MGFFDWFFDFSSPSWKSRETGASARRSVRASDIDDILELSDNPLGDDHLLYTRIIPLLAAAASMAEGRRLSAQGERIDEYNDFVRRVLSRKGAQVAYSKNFIRKTIREAEKQNYSASTYAVWAADAYKQIGDHGEQVVRDARRLAGGGDESVYGLFLTTAGAAPREEREDGRTFHVRTDHDGSSWRGSSFSDFSRSGRDSYFGDWSRRAQGEYSSGAGRHVHITWQDGADPEASWLTELGLASGAGNEEVKKAYRKMLKKYHPDLFSGDRATAEEKTRKITEAYRNIRHHRGF